MIYYLHLSQLFLKYISIDIFLSDNINLVPFHSSFYLPLLCVCECLRVCVRVYMCVCVCVFESAFPVFELPT